MKTLVLFDEAAASGVHVALQTAWMHCGFPVVELQQQEHSGPHCRGVLRLHNSMSAVQYKFIRAGS
jgi:hypothetical protein